MFVNILCSYFDRKVTKAAERSIIYRHFIFIFLLLNNINNGCENRMFAGDSLDSLNDNLTIHCNMRLYKYR